MRIIDLTLPVRDGMAGYPGDPAVAIRQVRSLEADGWRLHAIRLGSHTGTHVNAPWHMVDKGERLEALGLGRLVCQAVVQKPGGPIAPGLGLIYADFPIDRAEAERIVRAGPPFVAQAVEFPLDEAVERSLCVAGIPSFENLANTGLLPREGAFLFAGLPLAIAGDGAPVRAVALLE